MQNVITYQFWDYIGTIDMCIFPVQLWRTWLLNCLLSTPGDDCELDVNGCERDPCSVNRTCTDRAAAEHQANPALKPYTCSPCPAGFRDVNDKCDGKLPSIVVIFIHSIQ